MKNEPAEITEARKQDAKNALLNSVIKEEIEKLEAQMIPTSAQIAERHTRSASVYQLVNKPIKSLLSLLERNSKMLASKGHSGDLNLINSQIMITSALVLKSQKSSHHLYEIEAFKDEDLILERKSIYRKPKFINA